MHTTILAPSSAPTSTPLAPVAPFFRNRTITSHGAQRGKLTTLTLEEVRDDIRRRAEVQQPGEDVRILGLTHLDFHGEDRVTMHYVDKTGTRRSGAVSDHAFRQLAADVLPARGAGFIQELMDTGPAGRKLSTVTWAQFVQRSEVRDLTRMLRYVNAKDSNGQVVRVLRAAVGAKFAIYDNLQFVEDLLNQADLTNLPVLHYRVDDTAFRLRLLLQPREEVELRKPVPMVQAWNSEVGGRSTSLGGGLWTLVCTNGMSRQDITTKFAWRHSGSSDRIRTQVRGAVDQILTLNSGLLDQYTRALDIQVDTMLEWLNQELTEAKLPERLAEPIVQAARDDLSGQYGSLANLVNGVTLLAQNTDFSLDYATEIEEFGGRILLRGLQQAHDGRITIEA
jgi:hypothetical protein